MPNVFSNETYLTPHAELSSKHHYSWKSGASWVLDKSSRGRLTTWFPFSLHLDPYMPAVSSNETYPTPHPELSFEHYDSWKSGASWVLAKSSRGRLTTWLPFSLNMYPYMPYVFSNETFLTHHPELSSKHHDSWKSGASWVLAKTSRGRLTTWFPFSFNLDPFMPDVSRSEVYPTPNPELS